MRLLGVLALEALGDDVVDDLRAELVGVRHSDVVADGLFQLGDEVIGVLKIVAVRVEVVLGQRLEVFLFEGLGDAGSHAVVEVRHALAAVHLVLVRLDGDARQRGVTGDAVGLAQVAVAGGEAALEELAQVDLAAGGGQRVEVHIMDMDVAFHVGAGELGVDHAHGVELLG